ncbi:L-ascorbate metabolism protein UlaG (beta-lactamase superfamily) [Micromonospora pisi]|uniref:L-ascorbate metabolism protein UlaG (Beta-lactamase superfamily) n=1 Tax=Micromonospora pisi TaxID=589240 RepID=A0A495JTV5_9ACTN|nr:MBL fold metallo-hydrolase [Micromonospora pisi]RKR91978.1 L-ascorbate metabolism protein UlaG (beta-lactamase superfamily) [Micromonospora pisi]
MPEPRLDRRNLLRTAAVGAAATGLAATSAAGLATPAAAVGRSAPTSRTRTRSASAAATFRWFGTAGWRIDIGQRTVLVDPYLSRYRTGLFDGGMNPATPLTVAASTIAEHVGRPETVLVTHSHWDHFNDVPHIATTTGARVIGTMTTYQLGLASGIPSAQLGLVKGGEVLEFGDFTVEVVASLHSRNAAYSVGIPGVRLSQPPKPATVADLPEGDTLAYQLTIKDGPKVFLMGASDFVERNVTGLAPDIAMIAMASSDATHAYLPRLIEALDRPEIVVPVHWDNFETELKNPPPALPADRQRLETMVETIRRVAPGTRIVVPEYLTGYRFA